MKKQPEIEINRFQLNVLIRDKYKEQYKSILENGVFCVSCIGACAKGVEVKEIFLNHQNDIKITGNCKVCNQEVARIMEFGEDKDFFNKANEFRKAIK